jgi:hypothetical protein
MAHADDLAAIPTPEVFCGPFRHGVRPNDEGLFDRIDDFTLAVGSGDVAWSVHAGQSAEESLSAAARESGIFKAGHNYSVQPRIRGKYSYLRLAGTGRRIAFESLGGITLKSTGRSRKP